MIEGFVNDDLEPIVEIDLTGMGVVERTFGTIDTGFNGYLCVPKDIVEKMDLTYIATDWFELGNGEIVESDMFVSKVNFDGKECEILVVLSTSQDILIGTSLLKTKTLFVDFVKRRVVVKDEEDVS